MKTTMTWKGWGLKPTTGLTASFVTLMLLLIGLSAVDAYLNLRFPVTAIMEENPLARAILLATKDDANALVAVKLFGTAVAAMILGLVYQARPRVGIAVALGIALVYAPLMIYICVA